MVFLASPGGLADEREACRRLITEYNERDSLQSRSSFFLHAWEDAPGGVGRPQELINAKLDECDFTLLLMGDWWGSPPDNEGAHTSGTEEEFYRSLELLAKEDAPMRDIFVAFKAIPPAQLRDPGPSLQTVLAFRQRLEASKQIMYETFDSLENLEHRVRRRLVEWAKPLETKIAKKVTLPGPDTAGSGTGASKEDYLRSAREEARAKLLTQADTSYALATREGDPDALLEYAKFMRRTGRFEQALDLNQQVISSSTTASLQTPAETAARVSALANNGVIRRKQGKFADSLFALTEAVATSKQGHLEKSDEYCYALDNLGYTLLQLNRPDEALQAFQESYEVREAHGDSDKKAQSAVNLGRQLLMHSKFAEALSHFEESDQLLLNSQDHHLRANAKAGLAESLIELGRDEEAMPAVREALELNERLQSIDGLSIAHGLMGRLALNAEAWDTAEFHLTQASDLSERLDNPHGKGVLLAFLGILKLKQGKTEQAATAALAAEEIHAKFPNQSLRRKIDNLNRLFR
ncbi:tetratricopeptide repeat protein [Kineosporia babensis]|uniref:Tetratricopeptide repeat protein n=1 Tax=Kineosporia babensis TaxID=499548 RepID=A0A9X1SVD3_9ACTN|nr:tetratricopeptide repeat protein [Kineosporia babensis]